MATAREQLAELEREFNRPGSEMHVDAFRARHTELRAQAQEEGASPLASAVPDDLRGVTRQQLAKAVVDVVTAAIRPLVRKDALDQLLVEIFVRLEKAVAPLDSIGTRLAACENRTGAISMMLARSGSSAELVKEYEAGLEKLADLERRLAALEAKR